MQMCFVGARACGNLLREICGTLSVSIGLIYVKGLLLGAGSHPVTIGAARGT
jgi:hypothetical protein